MLRDGPDGWLSRSRAGAKEAAFAPARPSFQALTAVPRGAAKTINEGIISVGGGYSCLDFRDTFDADKSADYSSLDSFRHAAAVARPSVQGSGVNTVTYLD